MFYLFYQNIDQRCKNLTGKEKIFRHTAELVRIIVKYYLNAISNNSIKQKTNSTFIVNILYNVV